MDRQGLAALVDEPVTVTQVQLTNGGHRLAAMRWQGVRVVPGMFHRDDVGESIRPAVVAGMSGHRLLAAAAISESTKKGHTAVSGYANAGRFSDLSPCRGNGGLQPCGNRRR